jgi:hypothetical protein
MVNAIHISNCTKISKCKTIPFTEGGLGRGWKYNWVVPLGTTSRNVKEPKLAK